MTDLIAIPIQVGTLQAVYLHKNHADEPREPVFLEVVGAIANDVGVGGPLLVLDADRGVVTECIGAPARIQGLGDYRFDQIVRA
jgi:hypothetical protein